MKHDHNPTSDRISHLPINIIEKILSCLPIRCAARTSILSSKWRHHWTNLPHLVFDNSFVQVILFNDWSHRTYTRETLMTIYQVLLAHNVPILKFTLSIGGLGNCPEIDPLMKYLSNNGIQDLTLHLQGADRYKLPSCLFEYPQLMHLNLLTCVFKPPRTFKGFSKLMSIEFNSVDLPADSFNKVISKCPLLERLVLICCSVGCDPLEIYAPNLKLFYFYGSFKNLYFKKTPLLATVLIDGSEALGRGAEFINEGISNLIKVFNCLPLVENIYVGPLFLKFFASGDVPKLLHATLNHLKLLEFSIICFSKMDEVSCALCLIASSPNLERIKIEMSYVCNYFESLINPVEQLLEAQEYSNLSLNRLQEVNIVIFLDTRPEMDFIMFLLAKSPALLKMEIEIIAEEEEQHGKVIQMLKEVNRFQRASKNAEIIIFGR